MPSAKKLRGRQKKAKKKGAQRPPPQAGTSQTPTHPRGHIPVPALLGEQLADAARATNIPGTGPTATSLTPNAVHDMYTAMGKEARDFPLKPVMQVLRLEIDNDGCGNEFWTLDLSDGRNYLSGALNPSLAHLVGDSTIKQSSTVRILEFDVQESPSGGRYCVVDEAEAVGPNPGRTIGNPFWLADDVVNRIVKMDRRATSHALKVFTQFDDNAKEAGSLLRHCLPNLLFAAIRKGFMADCMTIKEKHRMEILFDWFEILSAIVKTNTFNALTICASIRPVLEHYLAPVGIVPEIEYYGTTINYFKSLAKLFKIFSGIVKSKVLWRDNDFFEFACGAVFWHLDGNTRPECHDALCDVCDAGSAFIRHELDSRAVEYCDTSLEFTAQLLSIANIQVCPDDSTFSSSMFELVKEVSSRIVKTDHHLVEVLKHFVGHDCVDRDMIRNIVELAGFFRKNNVLWWDCPIILNIALRVSDDHHGSSDRRMSIAVDAGLIELLLKMNDEEDDVTLVELMKYVVDLLEQGATRGSKLCLSIARVDVEELMRLPEVDVDGPFSHRIEQLVVSARELCTRTCTCCAASLAVGRIFRCEICRTVYCSSTCQSKDWIMGGHKLTCKSYGLGHGKRRGGRELHSLSATMAATQVTAASKLGRDGSHGSELENLHMPPGPNSEDHIEYSAPGCTILENAQLLSAGMMATEVHGAPREQRDPDGSVSKLSSEETTSESVLAQLREVNIMASEVIGPFDGEYYAEVDGKVIIVVTGDCKEWHYSNKSPANTLRFTLVQGAGVKAQAPSGRRHLFGTVGSNHTFDIEPTEQWVYFQRSDSSLDIIISCERIAFA